MEHAEAVAGTASRRRSRRLSVLGELISFMWQNKLWWMIPIILVLLAFTGLIMATGSVAIPFIYTLW